jgi:hypothetical protein
LTHHKDVRVSPKRRNTMIRDWGREWRPSKPYEIHQDTAKWMGILNMKSDSFNIDGLTFNLYVVALIAECWIHAWEHLHNTTVNWIYFLRIQSFP